MIMTVQELEKYKDVLHLLNRELNRTIRLKKILSLC